jgi:hypothetical protein
MAGFCGGAHGELVHVCFTDDDAVFLFDSGDDFRVVGGNKIFEHPRRTGCGYSFCADGIFDGYGDACQFAYSFSFCDFFIDLFCLFESFLFDKGNVGVDCWFTLVDCFKNGVDTLLGCGFIASYFLDGFVGC